MKLTLDLDFESDLLDEVNVNGETYYKLNEQADLDKVVRNLVETELRRRLDWRFDERAYTPLVKNFMEENKEEIIEKIVAKISRSTKLRNGIKEERQIQETSQDDEVE